MNSPSTTTTSFPSSDISSGSASGSWITSPRRAVGSDARAACTRRLTAADDQVFMAAEKCRRHGIGVLFNLIVGFPNEPVESVAATLDVAKKLRAFGPDFQVALFYYRPYPGTPITTALAHSGHTLPRSLEEW